jgi:AAA domain-containing protein
MAADPDAILQGLAEPVVIDEWQEAPDVLGAVKRAVDDDPRPGRFILTGSVRAELESRVWPGTGRILQVPMYGFTVRELRGRTAEPTFIDRVAAEGVSAVQTRGEELNLRGYLDLMLEGSFPEPALRTPPAARRRWFEGYVEQMITRDIPAIAPRRDPELLRRYLSRRPPLSPRPMPGISPGCAMRSVGPSPPGSCCIPGRTSSRSATASSQPLCLLSGRRSSQRQRGDGADPAAPKGRRCCWLSELPKQPGRDRYVAFLDLAGGALGQLVDDPDVARVLVGRDLALRIVT